jgi:hypothetical protein
MAFAGLFRIIGIAVQLPSEPVFRFDRKRRSAWIGISVQNASVRAPQRRPADAGPLRIERVVDRSVRGEEALSGVHGLEPGLLALSSPDREMCAFSGVVLTQPTWPAAISQPEHSERRPIGGLAIGDDALWFDALVRSTGLKGFSVASVLGGLLYDKMETIAFIIDGAPQTDALTANASDHLVELPSWRGRSSAAPSRPIFDILAAVDSEIAGPVRKYRFSSPVPAILRGCCERKADANVAPAVTRSGCR